MRERSVSRVSCSATSSTGSSRWGGRCRASERNCWSAPAKTARALPVVEAHFGATGSVLNELHAELRRIHPPMRSTGTGG